VEAMATIVAPCGALAQGVPGYEARAGQVALARLVSKPYGRWLVAGLPPAPLVRTVADVAVFCTGRGQGDV
jgi:hypothetical protein